MKKINKRYLKNLSIKRLLKNSSLLGLMSIGLMYSTVNAESIEQYNDDTTSVVNSNDNEDSQLINVRIAKRAKAIVDGRIFSIHPQPNAAKDCFQVRILTTKGTIRVLDNVCDNE